MLSLSGRTTPEGSCLDRDQPTEGEEDCQEASLMIPSLEASPTKANQGVSLKEASLIEEVREADHLTDHRAATQTTKKNNL